MRGGTQTQTVICQREDGTSALEENCDINTKPSNIRACNTQACPTCNDGVQNGDETGIDCGGSCSACQTFEWVELGDWTTCVGNCGGGGTQTQTVICQRQEDLVQVGEEFCDLNTKPQTTKSCYVSCPTSNTIRLIECVPTSYAQNKWINNPYKNKVNMNYAWLNCDYNLGGIKCGSTKYDGCIVWFSNYKSTNRIYDNCIAIKYLYFGYLLGGALGADGTIIDKTDAFRGSLIVYPVNRYMKICT